MCSSSCFYTYLPAAGSTSEEDDVDSRLLETTLSAIDQSSEEIMKLISYPFPLECDPLIPELPSLRARGSVQNAIYLPLEDFLFPAGTQQETRPQLVSTKTRGLPVVTSGSTVVRRPELFPDGLATPLFYDNDLESPFNYMGDCIRSLEPRNKDITPRPKKSNAKRKMASVDTESISDPEEELRNETRRAKNRRTAAASRERTKAKMQFLENANRLLLEENRELEEELRSLTGTPPLK